MSNSKIPVIVGITGHRTIHNQDSVQIYQAVVSLLKELKAKCPNSPIHMMNSLAEGADLLCADAAASLGIPLIVVLPFDADQYTSHFSEDDKKRFDTHLKSAKSVLVAPEVEIPTSSVAEQDFRFRQAGIYIASHCHVLLALWDGDESKKDGCGTAACINWMLTGAYDPKDGLPVRPKKASMVFHVTTPRFEEIPAGEIKPLGDTVSFEEILSRTDEFNRLASSQKNISSSLFGQTEVDSKIQNLEQLYALADKLSLRYAARYRHVLALMALLGTLLTLSFLLYDEAELHWMILATGVALLFMFLCHRYAIRSACHRRYLEYRVLAESLRVQAFLKYAGSELDVPALMPLTQQEETTWVQIALCALSAERINLVSHPIRDVWIENQCTYHSSATVKSQRKLAGSDRIVKVALIASASLYVIALILELTLFGTFFPSAVKLGNPDLFRTVLKIVLGGISAATLFIANFYGKQSLVRGEIDHVKMQHFYERILAAFERQGQTEQLLKCLAREELNENGNWYSYQSNNTPDINL